MSIPDVILRRDQMFGRLQKSSAMKASPENSDNPPSPSQGAPLNWLQWWKDTVALLRPHVLDRLRIVDLAEPKQTMAGIERDTEFRGFNVWILVLWTPTKAAQRMVAEALARDLGPKGIHVAYVVIDAVIDMPFARKRWPDYPDDFYTKPDDLAGEIYHLAHQPKSAWSFLIELRPFGENW